MSTAAIPSPPPQPTMLEVISGFWIARAIYVAAKLGLADHMLEAPRSAVQLAEATGAHAPSLYRVLRALAGFGILREEEGSRFALTSLGQTLVTDAPGSLRHYLMVELGDDHYEAWADVLEAVGTGQVAFRRHYGREVFEYYARNREAGENFDRAMDNVSGVMNPVLLRAYDASWATRIVDVAGGNGALLAALLRANPRAQGVLYDVEAVADGARRLFEAEGLTERCQIISGSFFESVPAGGDLYVLKGIIHDWDDRHAAAILKNCRAVIAPSGRLVLIESLLGGPNEPSFAKLMDLNMLVMTGGRERTETEYGGLVARSGFRLARVIPTEVGQGLFEAVPA